VNIVTALAILLSLGTVSPTIERPQELVLTIMLVGICLSRSRWREVARTKCLEYKYQSQKTIYSFGRIARSTSAIWV
jgi:hypothetical protein